MPFDPKKSKIAITIPHFKLLAKADGFFGRYSKPGPSRLTKTAARSPAAPSWA